MLQLYPNWTLEARLSPKEYKAGIANINIQDDNADEVSEEQIEELHKAVRLIQCTFFKCFGCKFNPNHIYLDTWWYLCHLQPSIKEDFCSGIQHTNTGIEPLWCWQGIHRLFWSPQKDKSVVQCTGPSQHSLLQQIRADYNLTYNNNTTSGNFIVHTPLGDTTLQKKWA